MKLLGALLKCSNFSWGSNVSMCPIKRFCRPYLISTVSSTRLFVCIHRCQQEDIVRAHQGEWALMVISYQKELHLWHQGILSDDVSAPQFVTQFYPSYTSILEVEDCFQEASEFIPERWYSRPEMVKDRRAFQPFSQGLSYLPSITRTE